jgi:hypothetical protein
MDRRPRRTHRGSPLPGRTRRRRNSRCSSWGRRASPPRRPPRSRVPLPWWGWRRRAWASPRRAHRSSRLLTALRNRRGQARQRDLAPAAEAGQRDEREASDPVRDGGHRGHRLFPSLGRIHRPCAQWPVIRIRITDPTSPGAGSPAASAARALSEPRQLLRYGRRSRLTGVHHHGGGRTHGGGGRGRTCVDVGAIVSGGIRARSRDDRTLAKSHPSKARRYLGDVPGRPVRLNPCSATSPGRRMRPRIHARMRGA